MKLKESYRRSSPIFGPSFQQAGQASRLPAGGGPAPGVANGGPGIDTPLDLARRAAVLEKAGRFHQAMDLYRMAVGKDPDLGRVWLAGGVLSARMGNLEEAVTWFQNAARMPPLRAVSLYNLARAYKEMGNLDSARKVLEALLEINPRDGDSWNNLGTILLAKSELEPACRAFQKAAGIKPQDSRVLVNLALTHRRLGRLAKALAVAGRAARLPGGCPDALALQAHLLQQTFQWRRLSSVLPRLAETTDQALAAGQRPAEPPFFNFSWCMSPARNLAVARAWSLWISRRSRRIAGPCRFVHHRRGRGRLTIGYLSDQFRNAATGHLTRSMFGYHDRRRFRVICYSLRPATNDPYCGAIAAGADKWVELTGLNDRQAAERIYADKVDILVDMTGHMEGNRLGILALRPAPLQVHYLGYPGTTGADFIDYFVADSMVVPEDEARYYSESLVWLPGCYQVNDDKPPASDRRFSRGRFGLPAESFVFCCFNTEYKLDPALFKAWMDILKESEKSVLWLLVRKRAGRRVLRSMAARMGVEPRRLVFATPLQKPLHLARLALADLALDTRVVNGHTTTADALQAGVPVVTLKGSHFASRVSASLLAAAGLDELVTSGISHYISLAAGLSKDPVRLKAIRKKLRLNRGGGLFNTARTVRWLERAYLTMWQRHLAGQGPGSFRLPPTS